MQDIAVQPDKSNDSGPCGCCGASSRTAWGYVSVGGASRAVYYVHWTLGQVRRHGANIDLLMGEWGDGSTPAQRVAVSLVYRVGPHGPEFASIDPGDRPHVRTGLAAHVVPGRSVLGNPVAADAYAILHAVLGQDPRLAEIVQASQA